jgi:hypothetical protein
MAFITLSNWIVYGYNLPYIRLYQAISQYIVMYPNLDYIRQLIGQYMVMYLASHYIRQLANKWSSPRSNYIGQLVYIRPCTQIRVYWTIGKNMAMYPRSDYVKKMRNARASPCVLLVFS